MGASVVLILGSVLCRAWDSAFSGSGELSFLVLCFLYFFIEYSSISYLKEGGGGESGESR